MATPKEKPRASFNFLKKSKEAKALRRVGLGGEVEVRIKGKANSIEEYEFSDMVHLSVTINACTIEPEGDKEPATLDAAVEKAGRRL